jgi:HTH-type transcriptional regulator/antitoxin HigA
MSKDKDFNVDELLNSLFSSATLVELFESRIRELDIAPTKALEIIGIEYRALQGILNGTSSRVDARNFNKLASFLNISKEEVIRLFYKALEGNFSEFAEYPENKVEFINKHFDLATLKRVGFIDNITDYQHIEERINSHFGYNSIFDYTLPSQEIAFSSGLRKSKNIYSLGFWIQSAMNAFHELANPYSYDKQDLMKYFPKIRRRSINVERGLIDVISDLYKLGVTVLYQKSLPSLHIKGATVIVDDKPCILLTDYMGYYPTLWHTLCHELFHVLFDLEEIAKSRYHISEKKNGELTVAEKEKAADHFASEFLLSKDKIHEIMPHINNNKYVRQFAERHQVHESFVYTYYAHEYDAIDDKAWAKAKLKNPSFEEITQKIENPWSESKPISEYVKFLKSNNIYN